jgi:hypothetical protein
VDNGRGIYLNGVDKVLRVGLELPFALIQLIRAGGNHTARTNGGLGDITRERKSEEI